MKEFIQEILKLSYILTDENIQFDIECISSGKITYMYHSDDYEFEFDKIGAVTFLSIYIMGGVKGDFRESAPINEFYTRLSEMCGEYNLEFINNIKGNFAKISFYNEQLTGLKPKNLEHPTDWYRFSHGQKHGPFESIQINKLDWEKLLNDIIELTFIVKDEGLHYVIYGETDAGATHLIFDSEKEYMSTRYHELEDLFEGLWITFHHVDNKDENYLEFRDRLGDIAQKWNMNYTCTNPYNIRLFKKKLRQEWNTFNKGIKESKDSDMKVEVESLSYILIDEGDDVIVEFKNNGGPRYFIINIFYNQDNSNYYDMSREDYYQEYIDRLSELCVSNGYKHRIFRERPDIIIIEPLVINESKSQSSSLVNDIKDLNYIMNDENIQVSVHGGKESVSINLIFDKGRRFKSLFVGTSLYKEYYDRVSGLCDDYGYRLRKGVKTSKEGKFTTREVDPFQFIATKRHKSSKRILETTVWDDDELLDEIKDLNIILEDEGLGVRIETNTNGRGTIRKPEHIISIYPHKPESSTPSAWAYYQIGPQSEWSNKSSLLFKKKMKAYNKQKKFLDKIALGPKPSSVQWYEPFMNYLTKQTFFLEWRDRVKELCEENDYMCVRKGHMLVIRKKPNKHGAYTILEEIDSYSVSSYDNTKELKELVSKISIEDIKDILMELHDNGVDLEIKPKNVGLTKLINGEEMEISWLPIILIRIKVDNRFDGTEQDLDHIMGSSLGQDAINGLNDYLYHLGLGLAIEQPDIDEDDARRYYTRRWSVSGDIKITTKEYLDKLPSVNFSAKFIPPKR